MFQQQYKGYTAHDAIGIVSLQFDFCYKLPEGVIPMRFWKFVLGGLAIQTARKVRKTDNEYPAVLKVAGIILIIIVILIMIYW